mmetsp:Transcript_18742/g.58913  ORF Transcript_18742/g.58913 Transcript_18742/m.58913 type:complete len:204 (+) Transcript_18742:285-896(+)
MAVMSVFFVGKGVDLGSGGFVEDGVVELVGAIEGALDEVEGLGEREDGAVDVGDGFRGGNEAVRGGLCLLVFLRGESEVGDSPRALDLVRVGDGRLEGSGALAVEDEGLEVEGFHVDVGLEEGQRDALAGPLPHVRRLGRRLDQRLDVARHVHRVSLSLVDAQRGDQAPLDVTRGARLANRRVLRLGERELRPRLGEREPQVG